MIKIVDMIIKPTHDCLTVVLKPTLAFLTLMSLSQDLTNTSLYLLSELCIWVFPVTHFSEQTQIN